MREKIIRNKLAFFVPITKIKKSLCSLRFDCGVISSMANIKPLLIPSLRLGDDSIAIFKDELLDHDFDDVLDALRTQLAPLHTFRRVAVCKMH